MSESNLTKMLPSERAENRMPDAKPLYTHEQALGEAHRCLYCHDAPCVKACPTEIDIPSFIKKIASGNVLGSATTIFSQNILGVSCARVCPVEVLCVGSCVYNEWHREPIQIGKLQRYATETALSSGKPLFVKRAPTGKRVALVGAGPASLACAAYLGLAGVQSVLFEKRALPGGLNTTGVAPYKLHAHESLEEVQWLLSLAQSEVRYGAELGRDLRGKELLEGFDAVFLGLGLGADSSLAIPGLEGPGVEGATAWIERMKNRADFSLDGVKRASVVGGGNTALDVARELLALGVEEVQLVYRRGLEAMSGYAHERDLARMEGLRLQLHKQPTEVLREGGRVVGLRCADTRSKGAPVDLATDLVVLAIGQSKLGALASEFEGVALDAQGRVQVDAGRRTGNARVWAGGDCVNGGAEVVNAAADGREAARSMLKVFGLAG